MIRSESDLVSTAYMGEAATIYDAKRFVTEQGQAFAGLEFEQLERALAYVPDGAHVLELGCGTGRFSKYVGARGYNVLAIDPSSDMIELAREKCKDLHNITFSREEGAHLKSSDSTFDLVFSIRVTNQTESVEYAIRMITEMIRVAKPGGYVLVEFVNSQRPFKKALKSVRLSFALVSDVAYRNNCTVERRTGVLIYSQTVLNKMPRSLVAMWREFERVSAHFLWRWASRGYILLRKHDGGTE
jgi:ubiquinone/menaquinone biosynthesis C-methylase UbiE